MKVRTDFVSNSSSSSYIVAVDFNKYPFDEFVRRVCSNCDPCESSKAYAENVRLANEAVLRMGMFHECLYIGTPVIGHATDIWKKGENWNHTPLKDGESDEFTPFQEFSRQIKAFANDSDVFFRHAGETVELKGDVIVHEYPEELQTWISVPTDLMDEGIRDYLQFGETIPRELTRDSVKARAGRIIEYVKQKRKESLTVDGMEVFKISLNTLRNTRDLSRAGYEIQSSPGWPMSKKLLDDRLDVLEARIRSGETFIYAVIGDAGEGRSHTRLFSPDGYMNPFEGTPAFVTSNMNKLWGDDLEEKKK